MNKTIFTILFLSVLILSGTYTVAGFELSGEPMTIYEFQKGYTINSIATDGTYILICEKKPNQKFYGNYFTEGYNWMGTLYLYNISGETLTIVPGDIPADFGTIVNNTVYWKSAAYRYPVLEDKHTNMYQTQTYYQYIPGDSTPQKLNIPCDKPISRFLTDGIQFITITGDPQTNNISLTKYPLTVGNSEIIPTLTNPEPDRVLLHENMIIYQGQERSTQNVVYIYNMGTGHTLTFEPKENESRQILGASENNLLLLWNENTNPADGKYQLRMLNTRTGETKTICNDSMYLYPAPNMKTMNYHTATISGETILWSGTTFGSEIQNATRQLYGYSLDENTGVQLLSDDFSGYMPITVENIIMWIGYDDLTNRQTVHMVKTDVSDTLPPISAEPSATTAGNPISMTLGTAAFAVACILADLRRKKY